MKTNLPTNPDCVVIGAGAAGIGASITLTRLHIPHIVLEAKNRVGGRAYSETTSLGHLWDQGCHWFHSADINILRLIADKIGHGYRRTMRNIDVNTFHDGQWITSSPRADYVWKLLDELSELGRSGQDVAASTLLDAAHPMHAMARHWMQLMYSADPEDISSADAGRYNDTHINLAVRDGYGALIEKLSKGLPIELDTPVEALDVNNARVTVTTTKGTITAPSVILAVPARVMEKERIRISPRPDDKLREAFALIPMGWYEKIALAFDAPVFGDLNSSYADIASVGAVPLNFELNPFGRPIAVTHVAGSSAQELNREGPEAMAAYALNALAAAFGNDIRKHVTKSAVTTWSADPWINGAYACAKPGQAHLRQRFQNAIHERILMAGEHTHQSFNATAHGAYESGIAAARRAAELLGVSPGLNDPLWLPDDPHGLSG